MTLLLPGNKKLQIVCRKSSVSDVYIKQVKLNGKPYSRNFITYAGIMKGGILEIELQQQPGDWGAEVKARPAGLK